MNKSEGTMTGLSRRTVLQGAAATASTLAIPISLPAFAAEPADVSLTPYLILNADGSIVARLPTTEMGQGTHTGQLMIIAEELGADLANIRIEMPMQPTDAYRVKFGTVQRMRSVGSWGIRFWHDPLRKAAAQARSVLITAAAEKLGVPAAELDTQSGSVVHGASKKRVPFGELIAAAAKLPLPEAPALRPDAERTLVGKGVARVDIPAKVDGSAVFGVDVKVAGMLHGAVRLAPVWASDVETFDETKPRAMPGVVTVTRVPRGVVVVAETWWQAKKAADAIDITFKKTPHDDWSTEAARAAMHAGLKEAEAPVVLTKGDAKAAMATAQNVVEATYEVPMLAHMCMEPVVCTARIAPDRVDLWFPTQDHDLATEAVAEASSLASDRVFITTPYLGGGFGRKGQPDVAVQAVLASKAAGGRPVKVMWSREDDVQQGFYRPAMVARWRAGLDANGKIVALECRLSGPQMGRQYKHIRIQNNVDPFTVGSLINHKYQVAEQRIEHHVVDMPVPLSPWRAVSSSQNGFFLESFIDEVAAAAKQDPLAFRKAHLADQKRHLAVLEKVAEMSGWGKPSAGGRARGIAVYESYGSVVAQVAEVSVENGQPKVHRVDVAIDCGRAINPDSIVAQMQGSVIEALGAAWRNGIEVENGRTKQSNFHDYPIMRLNEVPPEINVASVEIGSSLGGVGEPGVPPLAPAVTNAIFAATGKRVRTLPIANGLA